MSVSYYQKDIAARTLGHDYGIGRADSERFSSKNLDCSMSKVGSGLYPSQTHQDEEYYLTRQNNDTSSSKEDHEHR